VCHGINAVVERVIRLDRICIHRKICIYRYIYCVQYFVYLCICVFELCVYVCLNSAISTEA
jgi:hypothetical protein